jgi:DNA invertase Pin-like site-specific DNA recombinase
VSDWLAFLAERLTAEFLRDMAGGPRPWSGAPFTRGDLQSATSLEDQQRLCRAYAERQNWTVVSLFEDAALSGFGVDHRPGYQQPLAAALSSPASVDVVLVEDLSRLTRDMAELMRLSTLRSSGG